MDGNLKLILGLVWTLILHYSISMPVWEEDEDEESKKATPKQRLLTWVQNKVPDMPITNFSQDWRDGRALGALVDSCAPGWPVCLAHDLSLHVSCSCSLLPSLTLAVLYAVSLAHFLFVCLQLFTNSHTLLGLCPDWETWDPVKPVENATEAMQLADDWLGIPQVSSSV